MAAENKTAPRQGTAARPRNHGNRHPVIAGGESALLQRPATGNDTSWETAWAWEDEECSYDLFDLQDSGLVAA